MDGVHQDCSNGDRREVLTMDLKSTWQSHGWLLLLIWTFGDVNSFQPKNKIEDETRTNMIVALFIQLWWGCCAEFVLGITRR